MDKLFGALVIGEPLLSVQVTLKVYVAAAVEVPAMAPELGSDGKPVGNEPLVSATVYGFVPPEHPIVCCE
jgi:hypothetical protein